MSNIFKEILNAFTSKKIPLTEQEIQEREQQRSKLRHILAYKLATHDYKEDSNLPHFHFLVNNRKVILSSVEIMDCGLIELRDDILRALSKKEKSEWLIDIEKNILNDKIQVQKNTVQKPRL